MELKCKDLEEKVEFLKKNKVQIFSLLILRGEVGGKTSSEIINNLLYNSYLDQKVEKIQNLSNQEKENIEKDFKKEKEYYLKDQANKVESISQLKEINKRLETDNELARKNIEKLTNKLN